MDMPTRIIMTKPGLNGGTMAQHTGPSYSMTTISMKISNLGPIGRDVSLTGTCASIRSLAVPAMSSSASHLSSHGVETAVSSSINLRSSTSLNHVSVLKALVRASGDLGLSALLPPPDRYYQPKAERPSLNDVPPHLPFSTEWQLVDFSLASVFASGFWTGENGVNLRAWVQRMLERYRYVIGKHLCTRSRFGLTLFDQLTPKTTSM